MIVYAQCRADRASAGALSALLDEFSLTLRCHPPAASIPASFWGAPEAGIDSAELQVRDDTPLHSLLHEACHLICMGDARRREVYRDAGGDDAEESAVCYLQLCLAERLPNVGWRQLARDMDDWGYSFRVGSTVDWFLHDAGDARDWLLARGFARWLPDICELAA